MELTTTSNNEEFIQQLNAVTGMTSSRPFPKTIKFNGEEGIFKIETDEKDNEGKPIYKPIGQALKMHIVKARKMVQSDFDSENKFYSNEFDGGVFQVFNQNKEVIFEGSYPEFKQNPLSQDMKYFEVLYIFTGKEQKLYRLKLSGSKLSGWFSYKNQFSNDNPARYLTIASCGEQDNKGAVKYYTLNFHKDAVIEQPTVVKRVSEVMEYINAYENARKASEATSEAIQSPQTQGQPQMSQNTTAPQKTQESQPQGQELPDEYVWPENQVADGEDAQKFEQPIQAGDIPF